VAVFLPIGFMGGIIGKFFHEFGITIVAAVLISMFVSFTLDPMLSSVWHDPQAHGVHRRRPAGPTLYDRTIGRVTGAFDRLTMAVRRLPGHPGLVAGAQAQDGADRAGHLCVGSFFIIPLLGAEFVPKADFSRPGQLLHAGGLVAGSDRGARAGRRRAARTARGALHRHHHQQRQFAAGKIYGSSTCAWSTARTASAASTS
jgi:hypothetical protein